MAQRTTPTSHEQLPLIEQSWPLVTINLRIHFDGPSNTALVSYGVEETGGAATFALEVGAARDIEHWYQEALEALRTSSAIAWRNLSPF